MKLTLSLIIFLLGSFIYAQTVNYELSMPKPQNHYYHIKMELNDFNQKELNISLPVWAPGSYLVREFSKKEHQFGKSI